MKLKMSAWLLCIVIGITAIVKELMGSDDAILYAIWCSLWFMIALMLDRDKGRSA